MSLLAWLDYSEQERRKMLEVIDFFKEREARDELGLGPVRDAFADQLFPGTSTVMTRARYYLLVPWTYLRLEEARIGSRRIAERARKAEGDLMEAISRSSDREGNIGRVAGRALKRLPSNIYWQGLHVWGIRLFPGNQEQYHRSLDGYYDALDRHWRRRDERDEEADERVTPNWHPGIVSPPESIPEKCSLRLRGCEARYLAERLRLASETEKSLLTDLASRRRKWRPVQFPWELPWLGQLRPEHRQQLEQAQNFSELMHGAQLLYNLILAELNKDAPLAKAFRERMGKWSELVRKRRAVFRRWDRAAFWKLTEQENSRISLPCREFINRWWDLVLKVNPHGIGRHPAARDLICERERRLKRSRSRIENPSARELWRGESGTARIDFRWGISQQILLDILTALNADDA